MKAVLRRYSIVQIFYNQPLKIRPYINKEWNPQSERDAVPAQRRGLLSATVLRRYSIVRDP